MQALYPENAMSHTLLPPSAPSPALGFLRLLPKIVNGNTLLHLLLHGGKELV